MGADDGEGPDIGDLQGRVERYYEASPLGKATMRQSNQAPDAGERERVRRHGLRIEGRVAEDVARAVHASAPIPDLLVQKGLPKISRSASSTRSEVGCSAGTFRTQLPTRVSSSGSTATSLVSLR
jgi:hypothetical protein